MVLFRKRFGIETLNQINELIALTQSERDTEKDDDEDDKSNNQDGSQANLSKQKPTKCSNKPKKQNKVNEVNQTHKEKLILDATCAPADIRYPTDLPLLNEGREKLEAMFETLHEPLRGETRKPRTYRQKARKAYLCVAKCKKKFCKEIA